MGTEKFCLRWNDFESNISSAFRDLREDKEFFDVTLACDNDEQIQAHKVILAACSPFFRHVLRRNPHQHPLLYLKGVKYTDLQSVLSFLYHGEVNVAQEELNSFLAVAEELKVKGLTQSNSSEPKEAAKKEQPTQVKRRRENTEEQPIPPQMKRQKPTPIPMPPVPRPTATNGKKNGEDEIEEVAVVKTETFEPQVQQPTFANSATIQAQPDPENANSNSVALDDSYGVDDTYDYQYDTAAYDTFAGVNTNTAGTQENTGSYCLDILDYKL